MNPLSNISTSERIITLDVIRGFALLGILFMNIQSFSMPEAAYTNPYTYGDFTGINYGIWLIGHVFFDSKFMALFSMLFGAGILLFCHRLERKGETGYRIHNRRMTWLLLFVYFMRTLFGTAMFFFTTHCVAL